MAKSDTAKMDEILSKLNKEQQECVKELDGKFLVLAGPGTGKTHTVIKRLQAMILQGVSPERILCMTYSRAGADEMKKRVLEELDESNNNVEIHTFHSFCNKIITEYAEEFNVPSYVSLIPESIKRAFIKECIDEITDAEYYKSEKANKYSCFESIETGIGHLKRYRITDKEGKQLEANIKSDSDWLPAIRALEYERDNNPNKRKNYAANIDKEVKDFVEANKDKIGCLVNVSSAALLEGTYGRMSKLCGELGVNIDQREFHCKGSFKFMHKGRPNQQDLDEAAAFAKEVMASK